MHIESGQSYIGSKSIRVVRSYSTLSKKGKNNQLKESLIPVAIYPDAFLNKSIILKDNKSKAGIYR